MKRLLLVDDERPILEVLRISLASEGYEIFTAERGKEGLEIFQREGLKLVLTDIKMPGMDGLELLRQVKALDQEAEVIVITGHGDMDSAVNALRYGASDFITKPVRDDILLIALERAKRKLQMTELLRQYTSGLEQRVAQYTQELRQAQVELIRRERLASIGETVAGLAHYIKNILNALRGGSYKVNAALSRDNPELLRDGWAMVQRNVGKISDLALDLLDFSKERVPERKNCIPNEIVREVVALLKNQGDEQGVSLEASLDEGLGTASLDPRGIHRVLLNLGINAIQACVLDGDRSKSFRTTFRTEAEVTGSGKDGIVLEVSDNGCGMTDDVKGKIFSRFFSTKGGQGTGLGLLLTQKIIREHGGEISVQSQEGVGSRFQVRLPRWPPNAEAPLLGGKSESSEKVA
jgi:signal transduction histidine kinase